ncbi:MAG: type II secretion system protein GspM [Geminicoccaceae bacterium]
MPTLSPALSRWLAVLLLLVPLAGLAALVIVPARLAERQQAERDALEAHIARLEQRIVTREQVLAELRQLERQTEGDQRLLRVETPSVGGAALAGLLTEFFERSGGRLDRTQVLEPVVDDLVMRIGVQLRGTMEINGLRSLLHRIETHEPLLTVERIAIQGIDLGTSDILVDTDLTVVGYARVPPTDKNEGPSTDRAG